MQMPTIHGHRSAEIETGQTFPSPIRGQFSTSSSSNQLKKMAVCIAKSRVEIAVSEQEVHPQKPTHVSDPRGDVLPQIRADQKRKDDGTRRIPASALPCRLRLNPSFSEAKPLNSRKGHSPWTNTGHHTLKLTLSRKLTTLMASADALQGGRAPSFTAENDNRQCIEALAQQIVSQSSELLDVKGEDMEAVSLGLAYHTQRHRLMQVVAQIKRASVYITSEAEGTKRPIRNMGRAIGQLQSEVASFSETHDSRAAITKIMLAFPAYMEEIIDLDEGFDRWYSKRLIDLCHTLTTILDEPVRTNVSEAPIDETPEKTTCSDRIFGYPQHRCTVHTKVWLG